MNQEIRSALKSWVSTVIGVLFVLGGTYQMLKVFYIGEMDFEILVHGLVFLFLGFFLMGSRDEELSALFVHVFDSFLGRSSRRLVGGDGDGGNGGSGSGSARFRSGSVIGNGNGSGNGTGSGFELERGGKKNEA